MSSADLVTLEIYFDTGVSKRHAVGLFRPQDMTTAIHARAVVADHLEPLPLCWVAEGKQRGATVEEWEISFDHEALPNYAVIDGGETFVTCDECKEWMHA